MLKIQKIIARPKTGATDSKAGSFISEAMLSAQKRVAGYLNKKTAAWAPKKLRGALILFCVFMGGGSLLIMSRAILSANGPPVLNVQKIPMPADVKKAPVIDSVKSKK